MSFSYDRYERRQRRLPTFESSSRRTALGYWLPLGLTVTAAAVGLAAWAWKEHRDSDGDEYLDYSDNAEYARRLEKERAELGRQAGGAPVPPPSYQPETGPGGFGYSGAVQQTELQKAEFDEQGIAIEDHEQDQSFVAQMRGAIRRTPSPQKLYEGARDRVAAGVAAVGKGLTSITEEKGDDYVDHERWSEEADSKDQEQSNTTAITTSIATGAAAAVSAGTAAISRATGTNTTASRSAPISKPRSRGRKRMVAVVVSAESDPKFSQASASDDTYQVEHASILSHLIGHATTDSIDLLILIYAPTLSSHPLSSLHRRPRRSSSGASLPEDDQEDPDADGAESQIISQYSSAATSNLENSDPPSTLYTALTTQAASLVAHPTHILPFTTPTGHIHLLKHLAPNIVYMQESLCGAGGDALNALSGWVGQVCILVGAEGAGLVDTETETETEGEGDGGRAGRGKARGKKWWMDDPRVGFGKGVEIVEGMRVGEDWDKRIGGR